MEKDLPAIFANLMQLNAYRIFSLPEEEWLHAILTSNTVLSASLLFNRGPRLRPNDNHSGRWIPIVPGRIQLETSFIMRLDDQQNITLTSDDLSDDCHPHVIQITEQLPITLHHFYVQTDDDTVFQVEMHRAEDDRLNLEPHDATIVIIDSTGTDACCIRTTSKRDSSSKSVYDCPCTASLVELPLEASEDVPVYNGEALQSWNLRICSSMSSPAAFLFLADNIAEPATNATVFSPRRPGSQHQWGYWWLIIRLIVGFLIYALTAIVVRIYIATQTPWSQLPALGRTSLVVFALSHIPNPVFLLPIGQVLVIVPVSQILFVIDYKFRHKSFSALDVAYLILDLPYPLVIVLYTSWSVHRVAQYVMESELAVLKENWTEDAGGVEIMTRIEYRLESMESRWNRQEAWFERRKWKKR